MGIKEKATELTHGSLGLGVIALYILLPIGDLFWLWTAIQLGSFWMFVVGIVPPLFIIAAPLGAWSLIFGPPDWVVQMFS